VAPHGLNKQSKRILKHIPMNITTNPNLAEMDAIILLDVSTLQQVNNWKNRIATSKKPIIVIDHHVLHPETSNITSLHVINEHASSTCEIVYKLFKEADTIPNRAEAVALFMGIAADTKRFAIATSEVFLIVSKLIELGVHAEIVLPLLDTPFDPSERVARLKAASRLSLFKIQTWLFAISHVSSHQASAARALISLGADVGIVAGKKMEELRLSMRSSRRFFQTTAIHLGRDVAQPLGKQNQGMGGGHNTAASVNGIGEVKSVLDECIEIFQEKLGSTTLSKFNPSTITQT
jgi:nanoRNase/pAp phosphatase (c-di-AMP/oligoRNAs hydrolase)